MAWAVQTSFIGDAILTLPFLYRALERGENILLIAAPRNEKIFQLARERGLKKFAHQLEIVSWNKKTSRNPFKLAALAREWKQHKFFEGKAYCVQRSFSTALLATLAGASTRAGFAAGATTFLYTHCARREWDLGRHEIEKNLDLLRLFEPVAEIGRAHV